MEKGRVMRKMRENMKENRRGTYDQSTRSAI